MPTLADKGYTGAGIGVHTPTKGHDLDAGTRCRNTVLSAMRAPAERVNALLKTRWKALQRISLCPWRIGAITAAALVLLYLQAPASGLRNSPISSGQNQCSSVIRMPGMVA